MPLSTPLLDQIHTPADLRRMDRRDLPALAAELRAFLARFSGSMVHIGFLGTFGNEHKALCAALRMRGRDVRIEMRVRIQVQTQKKTNKRRNETQMPWDTSAGDVAARRRQ